MTVPKRGRCEHHVPHLQTNWSWIFLWGKTCTPICLQYILLLFNKNDKLRYCDIKDHSCNFIKRSCNLKERLYDYIERLCDFIERSCNFIKRLCGFIERSCNLIERLCNYIKRSAISCSTNMSFKQRFKLMQNISVFIRAKIRS